MTKRFYVLVHFCIVGFADHFLKHRHKYFSFYLLDICNGIKQGELSKKNDERTVYSTCPKASNPYHECDENCFKRNTNTDTQGIRKETGFAPSLF